MKLTSQQVSEIVNSTSIDELRGIVIRAQVDHQMHRDVSLNQLCEVLSLAFGTLYELAKDKA